MYTKYAIIIKIRKLKVFKFIHVINTFPFTMIFANVDEVF